MDVRDFSLVYLSIESIFIAFCFAVLIIVFKFRSKLFLYYTLFQISIFALVYGICCRSLWTDVIDISEYFVSYNVFTHASASFFSILFVLEFLVALRSPSNLYHTARLNNTVGLPNFIVVMRNLHYAVSLIMIALVVATYFAPQFLPIIELANKGGLPLLGAIGSVIVIYVMWKAWSANRLVGRIFVFAWTVMMVATSIYIVSLILESQGYEYPYFLPLRHIVFSLVPSLNLSVLWPLSFTSIPPIELKMLSQI